MAPPPQIQVRWLLLPLLGALCVGACSSDDNGGGGSEGGAGGGAGSAGSSGSAGAGGTAGSASGGSAGVAGSGGAENTRSMRMGFSPWPWDATVSAVNDTYDKIATHGDLNAHHIDGGIPWEEALTGAPYPSNVENELRGRVSHLDANKPTYLALAPLNPARNQLADTWGASPNMPREGAWATRDFDSTEVQTAYGNFALDLIDRFKPDYFNDGIEVSELLLNDSQAFDKYVGFACNVYTRIKQQHPDLPVFVSIALKHPDSADAKTMQQNFDKLLPCTDWIGVSTYGYVFYGHPNAGDPDNLPNNWLSQAQDIAPGKPLAITETGWIAEDLVIPTYGVNVKASEENQRAYVERMLKDSNALGARFVMWFTVVDFDPFWNGLLGQDPLAQIWRDTGLYSDTNTARSGLAEWDAWLARAPAP
ncbi:MAG: hypothetical protein R3B07_10995 [Polyangiaceae bacterium]